MAKEKLLTITFVVDDDVDAEALERDIHLFNEGATEDEGSVTFASTSRDFKCIERITLIEVCDDDAFSPMSLPSPAAN